jgi:hypothetical protein
VDIDGLDGVDGADIGTKGDEAILILLGFDVDADVDTDDFTFDIGADVVVLDTDVAAGVNVLLDLIDFELEIFGIDGTVEEFEMDVFILLNAGASLPLALTLTLVFVDGGPDTSENDDILKFTGVGVFLTSGEGDGAGVGLYSSIGDCSGVFMLSKGGGESTIDSTSLDVLSFNDGLDFELRFELRFELELGFEIDI